MILLLFLFGLALGAETGQQGQDEARIDLTIGGRDVAVYQGTCPPFWFNYNSRCYKYVATRLSWADAELQCVSEGANLVSIHSRDEDDFIRSLIRNFDPSEGYTWNGLSDTQKEGTWMWSDGSAVNFVFWHSAQPDDSGGREDCVHYNYGSEKKWNDVPCSVSYPFVCKTRLSCN